MDKLLSLLKQRKVQILIIALLTFLAYSNIFQNQFVIDDTTFIFARKELETPPEEGRGFIVKWEGSRSINITDAFRGVVPPGHEGVYRPLRGVLYSIYYQIWGTNPFGYHLHSVLVHIFSTILIYLIFEKITKKRAVAFAGALLFGLHPIHTETVDYISVGMEATGIVFFLASFFLFLKPPRSHLVRLIASVTFALLAFFTYEMTLVLPFLIVFYDLCLGRLKLKNFGKRFKIYGLYFTPLVIYFLIRLSLGITGRGIYLAGNFYLTILASVKVLFKYLELTVLPINLAHSHVIPNNIEAILYRGHSLDQFLAQNIFDLAFLISFCTLFFLGFIAWKSFKKYPLITFGIGWFFISLAPVLNIIPQWSLMHEKFLYVPSLGVILIFAYLLDKFFSKKLAFFLILIPLSITFFYLTFTRNQDWLSPVTLWTKDTKTYPESNAYANFQLGEAYIALGDKDKAIESYRRAFEINPSFAVAIASEARTHEQKEEKDKAIEDYQKAVQADPGFWEGKLILDNLTRQEYESPLGFSFFYPSSWKVRDVGNLLRITGENNFTLEMQKDQNTGSVESYLKKQQESYGILVNQGLAEIPGVDSAYVKVFSSQGIQKMQFFLFKGNKIVKILVFPSDSLLMKQFDKIVGSLVF